MTRSVPTNKRLWESLKRIVKKQYKTWPSAYASGALVKLYKAKGGTFQ